jgi:hypothetical protein
LGFGGRATPLVTAVEGSTERQRRILQCAGFFGVAARLFDARSRGRQREVVAQTAIDQRIERGVVIFAPSAALYRNGIGERSIRRAVEALRERRTRPLIGRHERAPGQSRDIQRADRGKHSTCSSAHRQTRRTRTDDAQERR